MDIASVFQIWSPLAGNEELVRGFELIRNGEIFWLNNNKTYVPFNQNDSSANFSQPAKDGQIWMNCGIRSIILLSLNDWPHTWSNTRRYTKTVSAEADVIINDNYLYIII